MIKKNKHQWYNEGEGRRCLKLKRIKSKKRVVRQYSKIYVSMWEKGGIKFVPKEIVHVWYTHSFQKESMIDLGPHTGCNHTHSPTQAQRHNKKKIQSFDFSSTKVRLSRTFFFLEKNWKRSFKANFIEEKQKYFFWGHVFSHQG